MKFPAVKLGLFIVMVVILSILAEAIAPLFEADLSIQSQLADSDESQATYTIYKQLKPFSPLVYVLLAYLMFRKEIKRLFHKNKKREEEKKNEN